MVSVVLGTGSYGCDFILEAWAQHIICIQGKHPGCLYGIHSIIPLRGMIVERPHEEPDVGKFRCDLCRGIRAAAVDDHDFVGPAQPLQATAQVGLLIPSENQGGDVLRTHAGKRGQPEW